jgi:hypothetical protein
VLLGVLQEEINNPDLAGVLGQVIVNGPETKFFITQPAEVFG